MFHRAFNDGDIQGSLADFLGDVGGIVDVDPDVDVGIFPLKPGDDVAEEEAAHGQGGAYLNVLLVGGVVQVLLHFAEGGHDVSGIAPIPSSTL